MTTAFGTESAGVAAAAIRERIGAVIPEIGITLGSGLGGLASAIEAPVFVPFADIPGFPAATVLGHSGNFISGTLAGRNVVALAGRFHMYEGHSPQLAAFPVRVMYALGARTYFASNAAGGICRDYVAGDLMIIEDHINFTSTNPLTGDLEAGDERFPDMSDPYDATLRAVLRSCAEDLGIDIREGVYAWLTGPSFETRAEVRMLEHLGADAVGMSTVPEVIVACAMGMRAVGVSCIANAASGLSEGPVLHSDVLAVTSRAAERFQALVTEFVRKLPRAK